MCPCLHEADDVEVRGHVDAPALHLGKVGAGDLPAQTL